MKLKVLQIPVRRRSIYFSTPLLKFYQIYFDLYSPNMYFLIYWHNFLSWRADGSSLPDFLRVHSISAIPFNSWKSSSSQDGSYKSWFAPLAPWYWQSLVDNFIVIKYKPFISIWPSLTNNIVTTISIVLIHWLNLIAQGEHLLI